MSQDLNKNTVSIITEELIREGKVRELDLEETDQVGRPRKPFIPHPQGCLETLISVPVIRKLKENLRHP